MTLVAMATGEFHAKMPWTTMRPLKDELLPPGIWPTGAPFGELSRLKRLELDTIFQTIIAMESPQGGGTPIPFRLRKCFRRGTTELIDPIYRGMPGKPALGKNGEMASRSAEDEESDDDSIPTPAPMKKGKARAVLQRIPESDDELEEVAGALEPEDDPTDPEGNIKQSPTDEDDEDDEDEDAEDGIGSVEAFITVQSTAGKRGDDTPAAASSTSRIWPPASASLPTPRETPDDDIPPTNHLHPSIDRLTERAVFSAETPTMTVASKVTPQPQLRARTRYPAPCKIPPHLRSQFLRDLSSDNQYQDFLSAFNDKVCALYSPSVFSNVVPPADHHRSQHPFHRASYMGYMGLLFGTPSEASA